MFELNQLVCGRSYSHGTPSVSLITKILFSWEWFAKTFITNRKSLLFDTVITDYMFVFINYLDRKF